MNRFDVLTQDTKPVTHPYELMYQSGLMKQQAYNKGLQDLQNMVDVTGNLPSLPGPDTEVKKQTLSDIQNQANELSKQDLGDPQVTAKIHSLINQYTPQLEAISGHYNDVIKEYYQKNKPEYIKSTGDIPSHYKPIEDFISSYTSGDTFNSDPNYFHDYTQPTKFNDPRKEVSELGNKLKASGYNYEQSKEDGKYYWTDKGGSEHLTTQEAFNKLYGQNPLDNLSIPAKNSLSLEAKYQGYKNPADYLESLYTQEAYLQSYSKNNQGMTIAGNNPDYKKKEVNPPTVPGFVPAQTVPGQTLGWKLDNKGNIQTNSEISHSISTGINIPNFVPQSTPEEQKQQLSDIKVAMSKLYPEKKGKFTTTDINKYIEEQSQLTNANIPINIWDPNNSDTPERIKTASNTYFTPGEKNTITNQGAFVTRKFYGPSGNGISGTEWIKNAGSIQPKVIGEFTPDNAYTSYGVPVQKEDGSIDIMEGNLDEVNNLGNNIAHNIYLAKYNNQTKSNHFDILGNKAESHFNPTNNSYDVSLKDGDKTLNYTIGGDNPTNIGTKENPQYLYSPEMFYLWATQK